jgi:hypothetical protein
MPQQSLAHGGVICASSVQCPGSLRKAACQYVSRSAGRIAGLAQAAGVGGQVLQQQQLLPVRAVARLITAQGAGLSSCASMAHILSNLHQGDAAPMPG